LYLAFTTPNQRQRDQQGKNVFLMVELLLILAVVLLLFFQDAVTSAQSASAKDHHSVIPEKRLQALPVSSANGVASM